MIGAGGFDSPELEGPTRRELGVWNMSRIITAGIALAENGDEEDCVRALVIEDGMPEGAARRFLRHFRDPCILAMGEASPVGKSPQELADAFAEAFGRRIGGGAA